MAKEAIASKTKHPIIVVDSATTVSSVANPKETFTVDDNDSLVHTAPVRHNYNRMIINAIKNLNQPKGSSLIAIKKHIQVAYACDVQKYGVYIKRSLKTCVRKGMVIQVSGRGANGSFKLPKKTKPKATKAQKPKQAEHTKAKMITKPKANEKINKKATLKAFKSDQNQKSGQSNVKRVLFCLPTPNRRISLGSRKPTPGPKRKK